MSSPLHLLIKQLDILTSLDEATLPADAIQCIQQMNVYAQILKRQSLCAETSNKMGPEPPEAPANLQHNVTAQTQPDPNGQAQSGESDLKALMAAIRRPPTSQTSTKAEDDKVNTTIPHRPTTGAPSFLGDIRSLANGVAKAKKPTKRAVTTGGLGSVQSATSAIDVPAELKPPLQPPVGFTPKSINWKGMVSQTKVTGTFWDGLHKPPFRYQINYEDVNDTFFEKEEAAASKHSSTSLGTSIEDRRKKEKHVLTDAKRIQHIEIAIKGLGLLDDFSVVARALENLDLGDEMEGPVDMGGSSSNSRWCLSPYKVERLLTIYPTEAEISSIEAAAADLAKSTSAPRQELATADKFLLCLSRIPRFRETASCILTYYSFDRFHSSLTPRLQRFAEVCNDVLRAVESSDTDLCQVFSLILRIGNYVNYKSKKPLVWGLSNASLEALRSIKGHRGRSLLRLVAEHIDDQTPSPATTPSGRLSRGSDQLYLSGNSSMLRNSLIPGSIGRSSGSSAPTTEEVYVWKIIGWLPQCYDVSDISMDELIAQTQDFEHKFAELKKELLVTKLQSLKLRFTDYVENSKTINKGVERDLNTCKELIATIAQRSGETNAKTTSDQLACLRRFGIFGKDLLACYREILAEKEVLEKKRQRERVKASTPSRRQRQQSVTRPAHLDSDELVGPSSRLHGIASLVSNNRQRPATPFRSTPTNDSRIVTDARHGNNSEFGRAPDSRLLTEVRTVGHDSVDYPAHNKATDYPSRYSTLRDRFEYNNISGDCRVNTSIGDRSHFDYGGRWPVDDSLGENPYTSQQQQHAQNSSSTISNKGNVYTSSKNKLPSSRDTGLGVRHNPVTTDYRPRLVWSNNHNYYEQPSNDFVYYVDRQGRQAAAQMDDSPAPPPGSMYDIKYRRNYHASNYAYRTSSARAVTPSPNSTAGPADAQFFPSRFYNR